MCPMDPEFPRDGQDEASCDSQRAPSLLHTVLAHGEMVISVQGMNKGREDGLMVDMASSPT